MSSAFALSSTNGRPPFTGPGEVFVAQQDVFSTEECQTLRQSMDLSPTESGNLSGFGTVRSIRACDILWLDDQPETSWIFERLARLLSSINQQSFGFRLDSFQEGAQLIRYDGSELGTYDWHADRGRAPATRTRKLSVSVQITPEAEYQGGRLELNGEGTMIEAPASLGTAIVFPSFVLHRVTPVTAGRRIALVAWLHGPAFS